MKNMKILEWSLWLRITHPKENNKVPQAIKIELFCIYIAMKGIMRGNQCASKWIKCNIM